MKLQSITTNQNQPNFKAKAIDLTLTWKRLNLTEINKAAKTLGAENDKLRLTMTEDPKYATYQLDLLKEAENKPYSLAQRVVHKNEKPAQDIFLEMIESLKANLEKYSKSKA